MEFIFGEKKTLLAINNYKFEFQKNNLREMYKGGHVQNAHVMYT